MVIVLAVKAQMVDPVHFKAELKTGTGVEAEIVFHATIDQGWHVYSTEIGEDGPIEATFNVVKMEGAELVGKLVPKGNVIKKMDKLFGMELKYFEGEATFVQKIRFTKPEYDIDCYLEYGACSDASCMPPSEVALKQSGKSSLLSEKGEVKSEKEGADKKEIEEDKKEIEEDRGQMSNAEKANTDSASVISLTSDVSPLTSETDLWEPVIDELRSLGSGEDLAEKSLWWLLLMGFLAGLAAVCMPCIWPIIPMTVSFFLKRSKVQTTPGPSYSGGENSVYGKLRKMRYKESFLYSYEEIDKMFGLLLMNNTDNKMALDYFLAQMLLNGNVQGFQQYLGAAQQYGGYRQMPLGYQDAMRCIQAQGNVAGSPYANYVKRMMAERRGK